MHHPWWRFIIHITTSLFAQSVVVAQKAVRYDGSVIRVVLALVVGHGEFCRLPVIFAQLMSITRGALCHIFFSYREPFDEYQET